MLAVQDHYKNPRWSTVLAVLIQMFGYPYVAYKAAAAGGGLQQWLGGGWEVGTEAIFWDRLFFVALIGYMAKDMHCMPDPLLVAHHVLCGGSALLALFLSGGARIFMFGTLILEIGSCTVNLVLLLRSHGAPPVSQQLMSLVSLAMITASHVVSAWGMYMFCFSRDDVVTGVVMRSAMGVGAARFFCIVTPILLYLRQKAAIEEVIEAFSAGKSAKKLD